MLKSDAISETIGRLFVDHALHDLFRRDPSAAMRELGVSLSDEETSAVAAYLSRLGDESAASRELISRSLRSCYRTVQN